MLEDAMPKLDKTTPDLASSVLRRGLSSLDTNSKNKERFINNRKHVAKVASKGKVYKLF